MAAARVSLQNVPPLHKYTRLKLKEKGDLEPLWAPSLLGVGQECRSSTPDWQPADSTEDLTGATSQHLRLHQLTACRAACRATCRCLSSGQALPCCSADAALLALLWFDSFSSALLQHLQPHLHAVLSPAQDRLKIGPWFGSMPLKQTTGAQVSRLLHTHFTLDRLPIIE